MLNPFAALRRRIRRWIATRTPRVAGPWTIHRRRVYIVPTRYGYGYGLLLFVMLLGAMNYSNSMAFALSFLLAGIGLLAMHYTHGNLVNLVISASHPEPVFAGDSARFPFRLANPSRSPRHALTVTWQDQPPFAYADVAAGNSAELGLPLTSTTRGWLPAPRFAVATEFPVGLFHAWTWVELDLACLVYPRPADRGAAPPASQGSGDGRSGERPGQEDFTGLRSYQPGDPLRSIHWKSLARNPKPMVKQFTDTVDARLWLDWQSLPAGWDTETRLSQLSRWIIDAEAGAGAYGLRLPGFSRPPGRGEQHCQQCLRALALFEG